MLLPHGQKLGAGEDCAATVPMDMVRRLCQKMDSCGALGDGWLPYRRLGWHGQTAPIVESNHSGCKTVATMAATSSKANQKNIRFHK